jgi:8-oxo-dGTP pyrophosphatase MutT (NUDIX family)
VIRKPFFPEGVFRAPSGAANKGESLEHGALRESKEETGLDVRLDRYVARISATFLSDGGSIDWTSHVLEATQVAGELHPIDTVEIAEARWATLAELQGPIRQALLDTGWGLFRYRVALTDLTVRALEEGA